MTSSVSRRLSAGDFHAGLALSLDSLVNLGLLVSILLGFGFPKSLILGRMVPGSALGVVVGNLLYVYLAWRLSEKSPQTRPTALPLGLDTPSTLGLALGVLGPAFASERGRLLGLGLGDDAAQQMAGTYAWHVGMGVLWSMGCAKAVLAFLGPWVQRHTPRAGLLGALGGIGLMLLMFMPLIEVGRAPFVGLLALGLVLLNLVAHIRLFKGVNGLVAAVVLGTLIHYIGGAFGLPGVGEVTRPNLVLGWCLPRPTFAGLRALGDAAIYLPLALPFALLTVIGGINNAASAAHAKDKYETRQVLWVSAFSTLMTAWAGGVAQPTPYIGHPAYKRMGAGMGYGAVAAAIVGISAMGGGVVMLIELVPLAAVMPVMMFVGLEICGQAIRQVPRAHLPAVLLAFLPTLANVVLIRLEALRAHVQNVLGSHHLSTLKSDAEGLVPLLDEALVAFDLDLWRMLAHGFILTAMLWASWLAQALDRQLHRAAATLSICAFATAFGAIHSPHPEGAFFLPWAAPSLAVWGWVLGYVALAVCCLLLKAQEKSLQGSP